MNRKNVLWNIIGSTVYAVTSTLIGTVVMRMLGAGQGGIFLFAFSTLGQHIFIISYFGMRPIQVTDTRGTPFGSYLRLRLLTCAAAMIFAVLFAFFYAGLSEKTACILIIALYKVTDGLADCYECEFQRLGRLDITGKSMTVRTVVSVGVFLAVLAAAKDLVAACAAMTAALLLSVFLLCVLRIRHFSPDGSVPKGSVKALFEEGKWLFVSAFLDLFIFSAGKYAVDAYQSAAISGYFGIIFLPASAINMAANYVIRPLLPSLSEEYTRDRSIFRKNIGKLSGVIALLTAAGLAAGAAAGMPVIRLLVGETAGAEIAAYKTAFLLLIAGGGLYALINLFYYVLVIYGSEKTIFRIYAAGTALAAAVCFAAAKRRGINGGAAGFVLCMAAMTMMFGAVILKNEKN